ncbi:hypothetical protein P378_03080 [Desulforamulus profundi]|uniref:Uncharacterized protein n=1 Tax=Desulforamulus profundi TaxID=1383067 RepID=A0A2C6MHZ5_9FIRM|nr:hypothetical protein [Desulforamulus profundi]PHJ39404.1 hypothetical protein P378_03080 [Desulforamulus profundi]
MPAARYSRKLLEVPVSWEERIADGVEITVALKHEPDTPGYWPYD